MKPIFSSAAKIRAATAGADSAAGSGRGRLRAWNGRRGGRRRDGRRRGGDARQRGFVERPPHRRRWQRPRRQRRRLGAVVEQADRIEVGHDCRAQHHGRAALEPGGELQERIRLVHDSAIDRRADVEGVLQRLLLIVARVELELERHPFDRRVIFDAAEQPDLGTAEIIEREIAGTGRCGAGPERGRERAERIGESAAAREIAPPHAAGKIEIVVAAVEDDVLAGEQAGAGDVAEPDRGLGKIGALGRQPDLEVDRLVLVGLVRKGRPVDAVGDGGVAKPGFEPRQRRNEQVIAVVGMDVRIGEGQIAVLAGTGSWRLQQPVLAPIVDRSARTARHRSPVAPAPTRRRAEPSLRAPPRR